MNHTLKARTPTLSVILALVVAATASASQQQEDILIADFEGDTYGEWSVAGEAFGEGPAKGTLPNQMEVSGFEGAGLVNSYYGGDDTTGRLTSPEFTIERRYISLLIGGGWHPGKACINLLVDGKVVRTATGPNRQPGGTEHLDPFSWEVADLRGKRARIEIVDQATGGWGTSTSTTLCRAAARRAWFAPISSTRKPIVLSSTSRPRRTG
jgi:hypothetical protein